MRSLIQWFGSLYKRPATSIAVRRPAGPVAYVDCGRDIAFAADFVVGMTLSELLVWLQENCSMRSGHSYGKERPWLPERLRLANADDVPMDYVIREGDYVCLADPALPSSEKRLQLQQL